MIVEGKYENKVLQGNRTGRYRGVIQELEIRDKIIGKIRRVFKNIGIENWKERLRNRGMRAGIKMLKQVQGSKEQG